MNLCVRVGRKRTASLNQRLVENSHRVAQADVPLPLLIPDQGAWPKLLCRASFRIGSSLKWWGHRGWWKKTRAGIPLLAGVGLGPGDRVGDRELYGSRSHPESGNIVNKPSHAAQTGHRHDQAPDPRPRPLWDQRRQ